MILSNLWINQNEVLFPQLIASNTLINCNKFSKPQSTAANQTIYSLNLAITIEQAWSSQIPICIFFDILCYHIHVWIAQWFTLLPLVQKVTGLNPRLYFRMSRTSEWADRSNRSLDFKLVTGTRITPKYQDWVQDAKAADLRERTMKWGDSTTYEAKLTTKLTDQSRSIVLEEIGPRVQVGDTPPKYWRAIQSDKMVVADIVVVDKHHL